MSVKRMNKSSVLSEQQMQICQKILKGYRVRSSIKKARDQFEAILNELQGNDGCGPIKIEYEKSNRFCFRVMNEGKKKAHSKDQQDNQLQRIEMLRKRRKEIKDRLKQIDRQIEDRINKTN